MNVESMLRAEIATDFSRLEELAADWNRLWMGNRDREIFGHFGWARAMWKAHGSERILCTPLVFSNDRLVAILPLAIDVGTVRFLGTPGSDYNDIICEPGSDSKVLLTALDALDEMGFPWNYGLLENLSESSEFVRLLRHVDRARLRRLHLSFKSDCPRVRIHDQDVLNAILKKQSLRRHESKLKRQGQLSFRHLEDKEEVRHHLPIFFRQHIERRALAGDVSLFLDSRFCSFYQYLIDEFDTSAELRFSVLELDGVPIAYHFGFETNGKFIWYKPSFDINLNHLSPGEVLLRNLFLYVGQRGLREFDFTIGNESFKSRFANDTKSLYTLHLCKHGLLGRLRAGKIAAKDYLRKHEQFYGAARNISFGFKRSAEYLRRLGRIGVLRIIGRWATSWRKKQQIIFAFVAGDEQALDEGAVATLTLSGLAGLMVRHPEALDATALSVATKRLQQGDSLFVGPSGRSPALMAWAGERTEVIVGVGRSIALDPPGVMLYDLWGRAVTDPTTLSAVAKVAGARWLQCDAMDKVLVHTATRAGFRPWRTVPLSDSLSGF